MTDREILLKQINEDPDYIKCPKCDDSLTAFLVKNSEGVENSVIARLLMISTEQVETIYEDAIKQLKEEMIENEE